ncbi:Tat pathway signal protein [Actinomadura meridiana]|uniref:Tat pathway signal protein n=1 Tax=Actinomadura meridiana TaxID=559626 RepID=A0ABP8CHA3_9ACTN
MAASTRTPNAALAALVAEANWTNDSFARAVNRLGAESGMALHYDKTAVSHWMAGTMPRSAARPLVCEALSRRLRRPVTLAAAGLGPAESVQDMGADIVAALIDLGSADMDPTRRTVLGAGFYSALLAIPGWSEVSARFDRLRYDPHTRVGQAEVDAVRAMTEQLSTLDDQFGGRAVRPMAAAFMVNTVAPYLRADAREDIRIQMLSAASDHCYLTGYMAMDEREDRLSQRWYVKALELAGYAGDHLTYCTTLRGMSVQAVDLGHGATALELADAASVASPQAGPRMRAFLTGQQAHAAAATGDRALALAKLKEAQTAMDQAESRAKAFGSYDPSSMQYHVGQVLYELGDPKTSIAALEESDRLRHDIYRRTKVHRLGTLAERKLEIGRLEEACTDWNLMLDDFPSVQSGRCDDRYRTMMTSLATFTRNAHARDLYDRGRAMEPRLARPA